MLSMRNSNLSAFNSVNINYSTLTGSTIVIGPRTTLNSTLISLGSSTNQTYTTMSQGNFSTSANWVSSLTGRSSIIGVSLSANAQTQLVISQVSTATSIQYTSTISQWTTLSGASVLPPGTITNYSAGALPGNGQYGILAAYGGYLYTTANAGVNLMNKNPNTPYLRAHLPLNGSVTDFVFVFVITFMYLFNWKTWFSSYTI